MIMKTLLKSVPASFSLVHLSNFSARAGVINVLHSPAFPVIKLPRLVLFFSISTGSFSLVSFASFNWSTSFVCTSVSKGTPRNVAVFFKTEAMLCRKKVFSWTLVKRRSIKVYLVKHYLCCVHTYLYENRQTERKIVRLLRKNTLFKFNNSNKIKKKKNCLNCPYTYLISSTLFKI